MVSRFRANRRKSLTLLKRVLREKNCGRVIAEAQSQRADGMQVLIARMNKNKKFQKEQLMKEGWEEFKVVLPGAFKINIGSCEGMGQL